MIQGLSYQSEIFQKKLNYFEQRKGAQVSLKIMNQIGQVLKDDRYDNPTGKAGHKEKHMEKDKGFGEILDNVRKKNINRPIIEQLNINSKRNQSHFLQSDASKHLQSATKYLRLTVAFTRNNAPQEKFNRYFWDFFASINKIFILAGGMGTSLSFYAVQKFFLIS